MPQRLSGFKAEVAQLCAEREHTSGGCRRFCQGHEALRLGLCIQGEVDVRALEPKPKHSSLVFRRQYNQTNAFPRNSEDGDSSPRIRVFEKP